MPNICWRSVAADAIAVITVAASVIAIATATNDDTVVDIGDSVVDVVPTDSGAADAD